MRIAHISDIHVARTLTWSESNPKRLLGHINYHLFRRRRYTGEAARAALAEMLPPEGAPARSSETGAASAPVSPALPPDLVLLTGDITQHGLESEFAAARELLAPVTARGIPILAVPGNHDVYGRDERGQAALEALLNDVALSAMPGEGGIVRVGGTEILPLHQCIPTPLFCSYGRQNMDELARAHEAWGTPPAAGATRIVIGHYPLIDAHGGALLRYRGLRGAEEVVKFCAEHHVTAYFCGHDHKRATSPMPGGCTQYIGGALSGAGGGVDMYACGSGGITPLAPSASFS